MKQKALIIIGYSCEILNIYLKDGWKVVNTCPMPGGSESRCLVIIEKDEK